jgi:hypothetical protein
MDNDLDSPEVKSIKENIINNRIKQLRDDIAYNESLPEICFCGCTPFWHTDEAEKLHKQLAIVLMRVNGGN